MATGTPSTPLADVVTNGLRQRHIPTSEWHTQMCTRYLTALGYPKLSRGETTKHLDIYADATRRMQREVSSQGQDLEDYLKMLND